MKRAPRSRQSAATWCGKSELIVDRGDRVAGRIRLLDDADAVDDDLGAAALDRGRNAFGVVGGDPGDDPLRIEHRGGIAGELAGRTVVQASSDRSARLPELVTQHSGSAQDEKSHQEAICGIDRGLFLSPLLRDLELAAGQRVAQRSDPRADGLELPLGLGDLLSQRSVCSASSSS